MQTLAKHKQILNSVNIYWDGFLTNYHMLNRLWKYHFVDFQRLSISRTPIENISDFAFRGLPHLRVLNMVRCQLSAPPPIAPIARKLSYLGLENNNLTHIPVDYFTGCNIIETVSLGGNRFSSVPDVRILHGTLKRFLLYNNIITNVASLYSVPMIALNTLDLSRNLLTEIEFNNTIWPSITHISLENNLLNSIKLSGLRQAWGKVLVTVGDNPWHCDVKLCWLSRCHYKMGMAEIFWVNCLGFETIQLVGDIVCNSPDERRNVPIHKSGKESYVTTALRYLCSVLHSEGFIQYNQLHHFCRFYELLLKNAS